MKTVNSGLSISKTSDSTKIIVYRLCERWSDKVDYLKSNLTDFEIAELKSEKNASLNIIGLISELEKNNNKEFALEQMNQLIMSEIKIIRLGCSDAIQSLTISSYFLYLLTNDNLFFKPSFNIRNKEIENIDSKIFIAYEKFFRN